MGMEQLKENVMKEVQRELNRANEKFPLFNSPHESYAVILEEAEGTREAMETAKESLAVLWDKVRGKDVACFLQEVIHPEHLAEEFALVACEAIQTAAMCLKYGLSVDPEEPEARTGGAADE